MDLSSRNALAAATLAVLAFSASALAADIKQSGEQKDMKLVGHVDLQGRGALCCRCTMTNPFPSPLGIQAGMFCSGAIKHPRSLTIQSSGSSIHDLAS